MRVLNLRPVPFLLLAVVSAADPAVRPSSDVLRDWSPCLSAIGADLRAGKGSWRLVGASLEPDSPAPLCDGRALCPDAPLSGDAGAVIFRYLDENGGRLCAPLVQAQVLDAGGTAVPAGDCEASPEGPIQRVSMAGAAYAACAGARGPLTATIDPATNDGAYADRVTGLGLPDGRPVSVVLTWQHNPPPASALLGGNTPGCVVITPVSAPADGAVGQVYAASFTGVANGQGGVLCWDVINGNLPAGLQFAFQQTSFSISGTPTESGTFSFTVAAFGGQCGNFSCSDQKNYSITIAAAAAQTQSPPSLTVPGNNPRASYQSGGADAQGGGGREGACWAGSAGGCAPAALALASLIAARARRLRRV